MATKRQVNDRNAVAVKEAKDKAENRDTFTLSSGIVVELRTIDYIEIDNISSSVEIPEKPTYTVRTSKGREQTFPLDDKVVEQSPEYADVWRQWKIDYTNALRLQSKLTTRAMFLDGTVVPDDWYDAKWERRQNLIGRKLPTDPEERWLLYLETGLGPQEAAELVLAIMRKTTLPEEVIKAAENTFRDHVHADEGSGHLEDA